jgi:octaprenyl-diphosphate synthase
MFTQLAQKLTAREVYSLVREDLSLVEHEIGLESISSVETITCLNDYLQKAGGKRLRPMLVLLVTRLFGQTTPMAIRLAAVVEMLHTATLVHDDVIDESKTRRGRPSVNSVWGNNVAVLGGDWLYMQAFQVSLRERNFHLLDLLMGLTQTMVEGELMQIDLLGRSNITETEYMALVDRKTASLFRVCARLGAIAGGQDERTEALLGEFGWNLGMAFQLVDDVLDYTADESKLGKPIGEDLREGKVTLPAIYSIASGNGRVSPLIERVIKDQSYEVIGFDRIRAAIESENGFRRANQRAMEFAENARAILNELPENQAQRALHAILDLVVSREN